MFGILDYISLFADQTFRIYTSTSRIPRTALADVVILTGIASLFTSYLAASAFWRRRGIKKLPPEWKYNVAVRFGFLCWVIGIAAHFVLQFVYWTTGPEEIGIASHLVSNLYYLANLGGIIIVVTALSNQNVKLAWIFLVIMVSVEFVFGFLGDTKEVSFRLAVMVLITLFFFRGRISWMLIALMVLVFIPYHSLFKIYRVQVIQVREQSALDSIYSLDKSIETVTKGAEKEKDAALKSFFFFLDRVDGRKYIEIITQKTGVQVPFLHGETFISFFYSFIPRLIWPEKPQLLLGQLMNKTFKLSASPKTFVPSTLLGEFYWNFGIAGVIFGMALVGILFAIINDAFMSSENVSTVGMLVMLSAFYFLVMRFETGFSAQYSQFTRVVFMIGLMAFLFKRFGWNMPRLQAHHSFDFESATEERILPNLTQSKFMVASRSATVQRMK
jgi:hypothetical protein